MKKIYVAILFTAIAFGLKAQCTPDNSLNQPGYYPEQLDTAQIAQAYNMVLQLRIPTDTMVTFLGQTIKADIDSIKLVSVNGMPSGFTYVCNVPTCTFEPMQTYCAVISGTATAQQQGVYPLKLAILAYAHGTIFGSTTNFPPQPDTIDRFSLVVGQGSVGIQTVDANKNFKIFPNPANDILRIWINGQAGETVSYTISDITGKVYRQETVALENGEVLIGTTTKGLAKGIYIVQLNTENGIYAERLMVE